MRSMTFVGPRPNVRLVALQQTPHAWQEPLEFPVFKTIVPIQLLLKMQKLFISVTKLCKFFKDFQVLRVEQ